MKPILTLLCALLMTVATAFADDNALFKELASHNDIQYTYFSPAMLQAFGARQIRTKNFSISASDLTSVETVKTMGDGKANKAVMNQVKKIIKNEKLEVLATKTSQLGSYYTILGRPQKKGRQLSQLLCIDFSAAEFLTVTYLRGNITLDDARLPF